MVGSTEAREWRLDCNGLAAQFVPTRIFQCETKQTWHSQHWANAFGAYCVTQNVLVSFLLPGLCEIFENLLRLFFMVHERKSRANGRGREARDPQEEIREGLSSPESPFGSLIYDWLIQGGCGILAAVFYVQLLNLYLHDRHLWTARLLNGFVIYGVTIGLEILCTFFEPHLHWVAVLSVAAVNVLGFCFLRALYQSQMLLIPCCCCCGGGRDGYGASQEAPEAIEDSEASSDCVAGVDGQVVIYAPETPAWWGYQVISIVVIVFTIFIVGGSRDQRTTYIHEFIAEGVITGTLGFMCIACYRPSGWNVFLQRNGCRRIPRTEARKTLETGAEQDYQSWPPSIGNDARL